MSLQSDFNYRDVLSILLVLCVWVVFLSYGFGQAQLFYQPNAFPPYRVCGCACVCPHACGMKTMSCQFFNWFRQWNLLCWCYVDEASCRWVQQPSEWGLPWNINIIWNIALCYLYFRIIPEITAKKEKWAKHKEGSKLCFMFSTDKPNRTTSTFTESIFEETGL